MHLLRDREHVGAGPAYDSEVIDREHFDRVYAHYETVAFWAAAAYGYPFYVFR